MIEDYPVIGLNIECTPPIVNCFKNKEPLIIEFNKLQNEEFEKILNIFKPKHKGKLIIRHHFNPKWKKYRERLLYA